MVRCAVCQGPIPTGDQFGFDEEFVVHRRCAGGMVRIRQELVQLTNARVAADTRADNAAYERDRARDELARLRRDRIERADRVVQIASELAEANSRIVQLEGQLQSERNLRALAELEARSTRQPQASAPAPVPAPDAEPISAEPVDATAARFRLLELD